MLKKKNGIDTDGVNEIVYLSKNILKLLFIILIIGIGLSAVILCRELGIFKFLGGILKVLSPLFIGFVVAWLFHPLVTKLTKKGMPRILASILVYLVFVAFLVLFFKIFIPIVYKEVNELIATLPNITSKLSEMTNSIFEKIDIEGVDVDGIKDSILASITKYGNELSSNLPTMIVNSISSVFSAIGTIFFGLVIGLYMLFDFDDVTNASLKLIPKKHQDETAKLIEDIGTEVRKTVNGTLLVACMVFVCDTIGFSIVGMDSALLFGLFCGITDLIPYIGPWIGTGVAALIAFVQNPIVGLGVLIIGILVQLVESYILQPIVMSKVANLHPVTIICGLLIFGHFFGIVGMILAVPIMSILKVIWEFVKNKFELFQEKKEILVEE